MPYIGNTTLRGLDRDLTIVPWLRGTHDAARSSIIRAALDDYRFRPPR